MINIEKINQKHKSNYAEVENGYFSDKLTGLKELFYNAKDPIAVLSQELENDLLSEIAPEELIKRVREELSKVTFQTADDFAIKVIKIVSPIWEITHKNKDVVDKENREMFTQADLKKTSEIIKDAGVKNLYNW